MDNNKYVSIDKFQEVINIFNPCIDDYLYIMDIKNDFYYISPNAVERFDLSENQFYHVVESLQKIVYPSGCGADSKRGEGFPQPSISVAG